MLRAKRVKRLVPIGLLLACTACSTQAAPAAVDAATGASSSPGSPSTTPAERSPSPADAESAEPDEGPEIPESTSGPLSQASFPTPRSLGRGWRYAVDPGDAEDGYRGNGTPALERDPDEVVMTAIPLGCARKEPLPRPTHVLEVDYRFRDTSVIALRMRFARDQDARTFHVHRRENLRACQGRSGGRAIGVLVRTLRVLDQGSVLSDRTPDSDPWSELAARDGSEIVLLAARSRPDRLPLTFDRAPSLAAAFRP